MRTFNVTTRNGIGVVSAIGLSAAALGQWASAAAAFTLVGWYASTFFSMRAGRFNFARLGTVIVANLAVLCAAWCVGYRGGFHLLFFPLLTYPYAIFERRERLSMAFGALLPICCRVTFELRVVRMHGYQTGPQYLVIALVAMGLVAHQMISMTDELKRAHDSLADSAKKLHREVELRARAEREREQNRRVEAIGRLGAALAHEINTPVQFVMHGVRFVQDALPPLFKLIQEQRAVLARVQALDSEAYSETLQQAARADVDYLAEHVPQALDTSLKGLARIAELVRSLEQFSHPTQSLAAPVDINHCIHTALQVASVEYGKTADIVTELSELPLVLAHAGQINQVILNLIVNASQAIEECVRGSERKGRIRIASRVDGECVVLSVSDTGGGIAEQHRAHVFEPFFTTKDVGRGTGQGLSIAHDIVVAKHHGSLWFETEVGQGTTFFVRLPVAPQESADAAQPAA